MADFRRLFYALALVTLLAGLIVPASAQAPPFQCIANAGVPPIVRSEGYAELTGDLTLNCTGGVPNRLNTHNTLASNDVRIGLIWLLGGPVEAPAPIASKAGKAR